MRQNLLLSERQLTFHGAKRSTSVEYTAQRASSEERRFDAWTVNQRDPFSVRRAQLLCFSVIALYNLIHCITKLCPARNSISIERMSL